MAKVSKKPTITPLGDRVLVKPLLAEDLEKKSPSGIIIPETIEKEKPEQGEVVSVGEGKYDDRGHLVPVQVKVGDRVVFAKYGYEEIKVDDEEYYVLREDQILAVIK